MAGVGDRVQVPSKRVGQAPRDGVVTGVSGGLLRVRWSSGEESTITPSMGSLVVIGKVKVRAKKSTGATKAPSKRAAKAPSKTTKGSAKADRVRTAKASSKRAGGQRKRGK